jgi:hypothetical protein
MFFSEYHFGKPPCVIGRRVKKKERAEEGESRRRREQKKERAEEGESRRRRFYIHPHTTGERETPCCRISGLLNIYGGYRERRAQHTHTANDHQFWKCREGGRLPHIPRSLYLFEQY